MKKIIILPLLLISYLTFAQVIDCNKLKVKNLYLQSKDSVTKITVHYEDASVNQINYPYLSSLIDITNNLKYDTLNIKSGEKYYAQMSGSEWVYAISTRKYYGIGITKYQINFTYQDLLGTQQLHTCNLEYRSKDTLICNYLELLDDTINIDFQNKRTDLKFKYYSTKFSYPNYRFESSDTNLLKITPNKAVQTYILFNEDANCIDCDDIFTQYGNINFINKATNQTYFKGKFYVGQLNKNVCSYDIVFKVIPPVINGFGEINVEKINIYPVPFEDKLIIETEEASNYTFTDILGNEVLKGDLINNTIDTHRLVSGIYFLKIGGNVLKVSKK
ncbi:MAG: hypothetical protein RLZZ175_1735 [Bacteroidota bacterium]|jgi:hypothetical protein